MVVYLFVFSLCLLYRFPSPLALPSLYLTRISVLYYFFSYQCLFSTIQYPVGGRGFRIRPTSTLIAPKTLARIYLVNLGKDRLSEEGNAGAFPSIIERDSLYAGLCDRVLVLYGGADLGAEDKKRLRSMFRETEDVSFHLVDFRSEEGFDEVAFSLYTELEMYELKGDEEWDLEVEKSLIEEKKRREVRDAELQAMQESKELENNQGKSVRKIGKKQTPKRDKAKKKRKKTRKVRPEGITHKDTVKDELVKEQEEEEEVQASSLIRIKSSMESLARIVL